MSLRPIASLAREPTWFGSKAVANGGIGFVDSDINEKSKIDFASNKEVSIFVGHIFLYLNQYL